MQVHTLLQLQKEVCMLTHATVILQAGGSATGGGSLKVAGSASAAEGADGRDAPAAEEDYDTMLRLVNRGVKEAARRAGKGEAARGFAGAANEVVSLPMPQDYMSLNKQPNISARAGCLQHWRSVATPTCIS